MKKILIISLFLLMNFISFSQKDESSDVLKARQHIVNLKENGALIVRVLLSKKKIGLYRKAGQTKLADKLQKKLDDTNHYISLAFLDSTFSFCPVYIIDAKDYGRVLNGEKSGFFLNKDLKVDSSIVMKEDYFLFIDRGDVYESVGENFKNSETTGTPVIQDAFIIKDKDLKQLAKPFPFYKRIMAYSSLLSNIGFYSKKYEKWVFTEPYYLSLYYTNKNKKEFDEAKEKLNIFKSKFDKFEFKKDKKNIVEYYKSKYQLQKTFLILPYNIYKFNVQLTNYYLKVKYKELMKKYK